MEPGGFVARACVVSSGSKPRLLLLSQDQCSKAPVLYFPDVPSL